MVNDHENCDPSAELKLLRPHMHYNPTIFARVIYIIYGFSSVGGSILVNHQTKTCLLVVGFNLVQH